MKVYRRGVSEVLGAILIAVMVISMSTAYALWAGQSGQRQAMSMADVIRAAERRQRQLLSLTYAYRDGQGRVHLYIYNYGSEASTVSRLFVGSQEITDSNVIGVVLPPKSGPYELAFTCSVSGSVDVLLLTAEGGTFIWKVNL